MFAPSQADVRRFFCAAWAKSRAGQPMDTLEQLAAGWIAEHPEWHQDFADADAAVARVYGEGAVGANPFLHVSMLAARRGDLHQAHHEVMECLGQMLDQAQRAGRAPDGDAYIACVRRRATADRL